MAIVKTLSLGVALVLACQATSAQSEEETVERFENDFMTENGLRADFAPEDFIFNFNDAEPEAEGPGGNLRPSLIGTNPFLGTLPGDGNGQNLVTLEACGVNQPHHHPRGTETSFIVKGPLRFGLVEENGDDSRVIVEDLEEGTSISIPQGLIHFAQNVGCEPAQFLANFPHRDPGVQTSASNFFRLPLETIRGTLGLPDDEVQKLIDQVAAQPNPSIDPVCAKRCGLDRGGGGGGGGEVKEERDDGNGGDKRDKERHGRKSKGGDHK